MMDYFGTSYYYSQYYRRGSQWKDKKPLVFRDLSEDADGNYAFDPSNVDASLQILDILRGGDNGNYAYAVMASEGASQITVSVSAMRMIRFVQENIQSIWILPSI